MINGKYSLPLAANGIQLPLNEPQSHEGLLDNGRQHFTYAQPLLTQPQLSVIISQDLESLYLGIYRFNTEWLITGCAAFVLLVLISFRVQRRIVDPIRQIKSALERNEFFNLYQPLVCSSSGRTVGCEVLMRWRHPFKGMLPPMTFIPLAEQSGLIKVMTLRQIDQTIRELGPVLQKDPHFKISFNICASHLTDHQTHQRHPRSRGLYSRHGAGDYRTSSSRTYGRTNSAGAAGSCAALASRSPSTTSAPVTAA